MKQPAGTVNAESVAPRRQGETLGQYWVRLQSEGYRVTSADQAANVIWMPEPPNHRRQRLNQQGQRRVDEARRRLFAESPNPA